LETLKACTVAMLNPKGIEGLHKYNEQSTMSK
jgi:hypothetical protein